MGDIVPIARVELGDEEINAAVEVLRSGRLVQGQKTEEFERAFAEKVGARHAIAVSSGTAALHIAYQAAVPKPAEVLVPSFSHISTASMVCMAGSKPVFCDIDPRTFTLDLEEAKRRLTRDVKAVAPVHLFGNACDIDAIIEFAGENDLRIVWDAAQAHRTTYMGRDVGGFADLVCYSLYATKNMTTGEGGVITTSNEGLAERCRLLRSHGQTKKYYHPELGFNYRMTEVEAAIGIEQLKKLDGLTRSRRENAAYLTKRLSTIEAVVTPYVPASVEHSYHQYSILLDAERLSCGRDEFVAELKNEGIGAGVHYPRPLHKQPGFGLYVDPDQALPVAEAISECILALPVHPGLTQQELSRIVAGVEKVVRINRRKLTA